MKFQVLRYFTVLAEELHFGRAAARLAITQPPLSGAIKALELDLGVRLLERDSKHVQLTPAGETFLVEAKHILDRCTRAAAAVKAVASGQRGQLVIGVTGSMFYREVPAVAAHFEKRMPGIYLVFRELASNEQIEALLHRQLDAGFINAGSVPPQLSAVPLKEDVFVCCLPEGHPLAGGKHVSVASLAGERVVMFARDVAPANHDNVIAIFNRAGVFPHTCHAARQWLTVIVMVANGLGVSLVPASLARSGVHGVRFLPLDDDRSVSHAVLTWRPDSRSPALDALIACTQRLAPAHVLEPA
jgi:DNA-binding transcriptional LysR family regulator